MEPKEVKTEPVRVVGPGISLEDYQSGKFSPIDVFEGCLNKWILAFGTELAGKENSGIAVLILASSIIQPLGAALPYNGKGRNNKTDFCNGFVRIFPDVPGCKDKWEFAGRVYDLLLNGLFHEAFIKPGLVLSKRETAISEESGQIVIDPVRFIQAIEATFGEVCREIREASAESETRASFEMCWSRKETINAIREAAKPLPVELPAYGTNTLSPGSATTLAPSSPYKFITKM